MQALAVANGVPADAIVLEERGRQHLRERHATRSDILRANGWRRIAAGQLAVPHAPRADDVAQGRARTSTVIATPPRELSSTLHERGASLEQIRGICCRNTRASSTTGGAAGSEPFAQRRNCSPIVLASRRGRGGQPDRDRGLGAHAHGTSRRGQPGFFLTDPVRGQRLAAGLRRLVRRRARSHQLARLSRSHVNTRSTKPPGTFRILVLGDSVTFGHGTLYDTSYPYLLEQQLREWRPDVNWEVWNLGVPGYNTGAGTGLSRARSAIARQPGPRDRRVLSQRLQRRQRRRRSPASSIAQSAPVMRIRRSATSTRSSCINAST